MVKTSELKKGTRIMQRNGWEATLLDNQRGVTRLAEVYGNMTELGSIYSYDIIGWLDPKDNEWKYDIELTNREKQLKKVNSVIGF